MKTHTIKRRIYYEHTDGAGVVYYSRYLYFLEQARTEALRNYGFNHQDLLSQFDLIFAVKKIEVNYQKPTRLDDTILVNSNISDIKAVSLCFNQEIVNQSTEACVLKAKVKIACLNREFKPIKLPKMLKIAL